MAEETNSEILQRMLKTFQRDIDEYRSCNTQSPPMAGEEPAPSVHGMYRVPGVLFNQNKDAYRPSCVCIGPLNGCGRADLQEMQAVKNRYMGELLKRNGTPEATLAECTKAILNLKSQRYDNFFYVKKMLLDGCFIIELLYKKYEKKSDPILQNDLKYHQVRRDLLLLNNQIPFVVLKELFERTVERIPDSTTVGRRPVSLRRCVLPFFGDMMGLENIGGEIENLENNSPYHILHFLHICYQSPFQKAPMLYKYTKKSRFKYNATKLRSFGVKFLPRNRGGLLNLKFTTDRRFCLWRRGHFKIPHFSINEFTESFLRNLIAFEHCCPGIDKYFTSHTVAMSILMHSAEDVDLLEEAGVICSELDSSEVVLELFKNITSQQTIIKNQDLPYKDLWEEVKGFCSPWQLAFANVTTQTAIVAAIILNLITLLSSVYTILSYYRN